VGNEGDVHVYAGNWFPACHDQLLSKHWQSKQVNIPVTHAPGAHAYSIACYPSKILWRQWCMVQYANIGHGGGNTYSHYTFAAVQGVET
jgi:hypothetical protein